MTRVPALRIHEANRVPANPDGAYVLYWMIAHRRLRWNFALQRAVEWAEQLGKPLLVFEPLCCGYRWASDRIHRFVIDGMADHARALENSPAFYYPWVEAAPDDGKGLLKTLAASACVVVADEFPCFMLPRMTAAAAAQSPVRMETVDANGFLPLRAAEARVFPTAYAFRRFLQQVMRDHLESFPKADPLGRVRLAPLRALPAEVARRWPPASPALLAGEPGTLERLPVDHAVPPVPFRGGVNEGEKRLRRFIERALPRYTEDRNEPQEPVTSGLSPYLHFGHVSAHAVFAAVAKREGWSKERLGKKADGKRSGWWGMSEAAEAFLDQLVTWRELGYNMTFHRPDYDRYESLPTWARASLEKHAGDPRPHRYSFRELDEGRTHDPLWNAAQGQLRGEGIIHNYLRMVWGKKILEWTSDPREALEVMIELNNRWGIDGRNPNSYSGIFWCLGRYDRPWGPERPIFGVIRYMSSENTARKIRTAEYVARWGGGDLFGTR